MTIILNPIRVSWYEKGCHRAMNDFRQVHTRRKRPLTRLYRSAQALWRDTAALWREFRRPILVFVVATIGGGWLYGELWMRAGFNPIPFYDLPYLMLSLMLVETVQDLPTRPELAVFWYVMPLIGIYILGRGATDFVRLFFNRSERQNAWERALVMNYKNHTIVIGMGHVGVRVVKSLIAMGFETIAIDERPKSQLDADFVALDVPLIVGDARQRIICEDAGMARAKAIIVATGNDFLNLEIAVRIREVNESARLVVRMWDGQFAQHLKKSLDAETVSASDLAAPAFAGLAVGADITTFNIASKLYSLIRLQIEPGSLMVGKTIGRLQKENGADIVLFDRGDQVVVHPDSDIDVQAGDIIVFFAQQAQIMEIVARNRKNISPGY